MMIMELQQDDNNNNQLLGSKDISQIIKGKRTKRQRPVSPLDLTIASASANFVSTSSTEYQGLITSNSSSTTSTNCGFTEISTTTTTTATTTTEEEEDMANCLILLAQGQYSPKIRKNPITEKLVIQSEKSHHEISVIGNHNKSGGTSSGLFVYQCKTCDRCFASFQALGGHRASHKKPKFNSEGNNKKALLSFMEQDNNLIGHHHNHHQFYQNSTITDLSLQISNRVGLGCTIKNKPKVHECSICGAEFTSGQALGGHMRRHRSFMNTQTSSLSLVSSNPESDELKKSRNMLELDLNLPAPEDDRRETKFPFAAKKQVIAFSHTSPLVDCHY